MMKQFFIYGLLVVLMAFGVNAIMIDDWTTYNESGNATNPQLYTLTGQLTSHPGHYGNLPFVVNDVQQGQHIVFDFRVFQRYSYFIEHPLPLHVFGEVSVNNGGWMELPVTSVGCEELKYAECTWVNYRVDYVIPSNADTVVMHLDTNYHVDPLETSNPVMIYFQTPANKGAMTGGVIDDYKNKSIALNNKIVFVRLFDYTEYGHVVDDVMIIDKEKPTSFGGFLSRTHQNFVEVFGSPMAAIMIYLLVFLGLFFGVKAIRRIIMRRDKR
jgi:hypothetical protein